MDRRRAALVTVVLSASLFAASCIMEVDLLAPDLPRPIYIETAFSDEETGAIMANMAEWNAMSQDCLGVPAFEYLGRYDDPNDFQPEDMLDDRAVVYRLAEGDETHEFLMSIEMYKKGGIGGYATLGDVLMFISPGLATGNFWAINMHELGHHLGLQHIKDDPRAVMDVGVDTEAGEGHLTEKDRDAFCVVHDCHCDWKPIY